MWGPCPFSGNDREGTRAMGGHRTAPCLRLRAFSWKCRFTGHCDLRPPPWVSPARVALLALPEDGVRERRGWGPEVEGVVGEGLQGAA